MILPFRNENKGDWKTPVLLEETLTGEIFAFTCNFQGHHGLFSYTSIIKQEVTEIDCAEVQFSLNVSECKTYPTLLLTNQIALETQKVKFFVF